MQMLIKEHLNLLLVDVAHLLRRHGDLVAVPVVPRRGDVVDRVDRSALAVDDAQLLQVGRVDRAA